MTHCVPLSSMFRVKARFSRSVNVIADYANPSALSDYIITPLSRTVLRRIAAGLRSGSRARSWSITGPYGAGKSACALFTAKVLGYPVNVSARAQLQATDPELYEDLFNDTLGLSDGGFFVVLTIGSREPLPLAIIQGLIGALSTRGLHFNGAAQLLAELERLRELVLEGQIISPSVLTTLVERTAQAVREGADGALGLLFIIDELGKLLEYAALDPAHADIFLLQSLSELADRSADAPVGLIVILHQDFARYADRLSAVQRNEWRKVHSRFTDIGFRESQGELLKLVGTAIEPLESLDGFAGVIATEAARVSELGIVARDVDGAVLSGLLANCAPLHPTVALLLEKLFRSQLAQNERSLFAFLTSGEPYGLQDFLRNANWNGTGAAPFYRVDQLYDYVFNAMGSALYSHPQGKRWAEIESALERLAPESNLLKSKLVKAIGLFSLLGDQSSVKASTSLLTYALADGLAVKPEDVEQALDQLKKSGIAVYRSHKEAYGLWEGSDVDLDERLQKGFDQIDRSTSLASMLQSHGRLRPYVAKRHLHETGTLRYFVPSVVDLSALKALLDTGDSVAEGAIVFVVENEGAHPPEVAQAVREEVAELPSPQRYLLFFAVPRDLSGIREALEEVLAWEWVAQHTPELDGDRTGRKELAGRQLEARARLNRLCAESFDKASSHSACLWVWDGEVQSFASARDLSSALSYACDLAYSCAPRIHNELVNRRSLSSAAAAARRNLIERMLASSGQQLLGITGYPPERSMYESVLLGTSLHREDGIWAFGPPLPEDPRHLLPVWDRMRNTIFNPSSEQVEVNRLFEDLGAPPIGVMPGVLPILLAAFLLSYPDETSLYREGRFIPEPAIADFEVLMRRPELFAVAGSRVEGERTAVVQRLARGLNTRPAIVPVVRALIRGVRSLPDTSWRTQRISDRLIALRRAFEQGTSPERLLFHDIPTAIGEQPFNDGEGADVARIDKFFSGLNAALEEWSQHASRQVAWARDILLESCGLSPGPEGWRDLVQRAKGLAGQPVHPTLGPFLGRLSSSGEERLVLESALALVAGKPPKSWLDSDVDQYPGRAREIGQLFRYAYEAFAPLTAEELAATRELTGQLRTDLDSVFSRRVARSALAALLAELWAHPGGQA